jgi:prepilin-type N-terminal cleavage/methylation domain-containing protein
MRTPLRHDQRGFTLIDMIATIVVLGVLMAVTVPSMMATLDLMRLGQATREVERELHMAKSRAVSKGRAIRIRFNCPGAREYRITELIGTPNVPVAADSAANRCDPITYPFPVADNDPLTLPNLDGPVRRLPDDVSFVAPETIEFWPNGTAHRDTGVVGTAWPLIPVAGINITLQREGINSTITVNGLGKILIAQ